MKQYAYMRAVSFYFNYLLVLTFATAYFHWFDASLHGFLMLLFLLGIPLLIAMLISTEDKVKETDKDGKLTVCHHEIMLGVWCLSLVGGTISDDVMNNVLCLCLCLLTLGIYVYYLYDTGKHQVLYNNPSVTEGTRKTASYRMRRIILKMGLAAGILIGVFFLVVSVLPRLEMPHYQLDLFTNEEEEKERPAMDIGGSERGEDVRELQQKAGDNFWLMLLRYVFMVALILLTIVVIGFALVKLIGYLTGRKRSDGKDYYELDVEENDNEEYTTLVPIRHREIAFPKGNNGFVRKLFYKKVRKRADDKKVDRSLTPQELKTKYLSEEAGIEYLTTLYEKARYSPAEVSDEEINQMNL